MKTPVRHNPYAADNFPAMLVMHHSGGTDADPLADTSHHTADVIRQWHLAQGWDDIGYHVVVEKSGRVVLGRPYDYHGAHAGTAGNKNSVGVALTGNFDRKLSTANCKPSPEQLAALKSWYAKGLDEYYIFDKNGVIVKAEGKLQAFVEAFPRVTPDKAYPHRKFQIKTCPGLNLTDTYFAGLFVEALDEVKNPSVEDCRAKVDSLTKEVEGQGAIITKLFNLFRVYIGNGKLGAPITMEGKENNLGSRPTISQALGSAMMSSVNPQELSLTIKSTLFALIPTAMIFIKAFGIDNLDENFLKQIIEAISNVILYGGFLISAAGTMWGIARKLWVKFFGHPESEASA